METTFSFIDIRSHTARLLIAQTQGPDRPFSVLARKRIYTRLAEGFNEAGPRILPEGGVHEKSIPLGAARLTHLLEGILLDAIEGGQHGRE